MFFLVTADHKVARHACQDLKVECRPDQSRWYAVAPGYGCSKSYSTPETAIREMLADHACTNIRMRGA